MPHPLPINQIKETTLKLLAYCERENWAGYDPYDALNSKVLKYLPFLDSRWPRIALTQFLKRSPINFRPLLAIPKTQNPKGLALFLSVLIKLSKLGLLERKEQIDELIEMLIELRSPDTSYYAWGYSFPWQTRTILVPRGSPNLVCTIFVANALLDAYEMKGDSRLLAMARSAADYIVEVLYWSEGEIDSLCYPLPTARTQVHNANFLGAALLCRVHTHCTDPKYLETCLKVARFSAAKQREDGSWPYGEHPTQAWIDNFHTGFNLCALKDIDHYTQTNEFENHLRKGMQFYVRNFFREDGAPKYFHNNLYPIDIHCVAQSIITLAVLKDSNANACKLADSVFRWAMENMWHKQGYFHYRILPLVKVRIPFMRWSEAWMLLALATFAESDTATGKNPQPTTHN
jgi:hypothetical protein